MRYCGICGRDTSGTTSEHDCEASTNTDSDLYSLTDAANGLVLVGTRQECIDAMYATSVRGGSSITLLGDCDDLTPERACVVLDGQGATIYARPGEEVYTELLALKDDDRPDAYSFWCSSHGYLLCSEAGDKHVSAIAEALDLPVITYAPHSAKGWLLSY
jgi:hypothetical protein